MNDNVAHQGRWPTSAFAALTQVNLVVNVAALVLVLLLWPLVVLVVIGALLTLLAHDLGAQLGLNRRARPAFGAAASAAKTTPIGSRRETVVMPQASVFGPDASVPSERGRTAVAASLRSVARLTERLDIVVWIEPGLSQAEVLAAARAAAIAEIARACGIKGAIGAFGAIGSPARRGKIEFVIRLSARDLRDVA